MANTPTPYHPPVFDTIVSETEVSHEVKERPSGAKHSRVTVNVGRENRSYTDIALAAIMERARAEENARIAQANRGYRGYAPSGPTTRLGDE